MKLRKASISGPDNTATYRGRFSYKGRELEFQARVVNELSELPIEELDIGVRAYNHLKRSGIDTVGELLFLSRQDLLAIARFGRASLIQVEDALAVHGLRLRLPGPPPHAA